MSDIETLERFFAAINRNDLDAAVAEFHPAIVRIEPEGFPTSGTYRGIEAAAGQLRAGRGTWAEGSCDPEGFFVNGDKVVVYLHARVRVHGATDWTGGRFADGFVLRGGKIAEYRTFWQRADALRWAGLPAA